jgi:hypothetical protein
MKYIFVTGAPGSKWSSVVKNIYYSPSIDRSDYSEARTYYRQDAAGHKDLMHIGAYWDPGMEFGKFFDHIERYSKSECETEFDRPFETNAAGIRIIKSHVFANHIDFLRQAWPDVPVVLVNRSSDACLDWWIRSGQFDITYPDYREYYQDLEHIASIISQQTASIEAAAFKYDAEAVFTNRNLAQQLGLELPPLNYAQDYNSQDIQVTVIRS